MTRVAQRVRKRPGIAGGKKAAMHLQYHLIGAESCNAGILCNGNPWGPYPAALEKTALG